jgi:DNA-binding SARP family transcriptional activator
MVEFRVLGPLEAIVDGRPVEIPAAKPRALLALLLLGRNRVVSVDRLIDGLWGDEPPATAAKALQVYVSQLRKALGADRLLTKAPGYSLRVEEGALDLDRFELLAREAGTRSVAGEPAEASRLLAEGLALWRGPALAEFASEPFGPEAAARLEDSRLAAMEERIEADLALGRHGSLIPELEELVAAQPLRERSRAQLMLALYGAGRQADALELYRNTRRTFVEDLGIDPSPELQELERAILRQDPALLQPRRAEAPRVQPEPPRRRRRPLLLAVALGLAALAAGAAALALTNGASSSQHDDPQLRAFVGKLENFLGQSRDGRREVAAAISAAAECRLRGTAALTRLGAVQRNRQSLLQQLAALSVPDDPAALRASDRLQKAEQASIAADWHYGDWLLARKRCGEPDRSPALRAARAADVRATRAKQRFLATFNPLARRYGQRTWQATEF